MTIIKTVVVIYDLTDRSKKWDRDTRNFPQISSNLEYNKDG